MKVYTVAMPGGTKDTEYEAYVRLLNRWSVDVTNMPRVLEKGTPNRWLYAWKDREDADRFAKELRTQTKNTRWRIQEFTTEFLPPGPLGPVEIHRSCQRDGCTYELHPNSQALVRKKFPEARTVGSVFIGHDTQASFARARQEAIWDHVAMILTGLTEDNLNQLGGYRVYDPVTGDVLLEPATPQHTPTLPVG